jgi:GT2 family glycosyltransferase
MISISIVSHGHGDHVKNLLADLKKLGRSDLEIVITLNTKEDSASTAFATEARAKVLQNKSPRGFSANHNSALRLASGDYFCVLNPDVRIARDPFDHLLAPLRTNQAGASGPRVFDSNGHLQASYRTVPTPRRLLTKALGCSSEPAYLPAQLIFPDWIAGMCMLFQREAFEAVGGFSERYFLYYEDVDICCRLWLAGYKVCVPAEATIMHDGQYASRHNLRHLGWHMQSIWRFFRSPVYRDFLSLARQ